MKKSILFLAVLSIYLTSCSADDPSNFSQPPSSTEPLVKQIVEDVEGSGGVSFGTRTEDYTYNGNKLTRYDMAYFDPPYHDFTWTTDYIYTGNLISERHNVIDDGTTITTHITEFIYDSSGALTESIENGTDHTYWTQNLNGTVTTVTSQNGSETRTYTFSGGNLINDTQTELSTGDVNSRSYTYDTKNGMLKNIDSYLYYNGVHSRNNLTSIIYDSGSALFQEMFYTYNSNDYPVTRTTVTNAGTPDEATNTATITYY